jgi:hypothetical protein
MSNAITNFITFNFINEFDLDKTSILDSIEKALNLEKDIYNITRYI